MKNNFLNIVIYFACIELPISINLQASDRNSLPRNSFKISRTQTDSLITKKIEELHADQITSANEDALKYRIGNFINNITNPSISQRASTMRTISNDVSAYPFLVNEYVSVVDTYSIDGQRLSCTLTPLNLAVAFNNVPAAQILLRNNADINKVNENMYTSNLGLAIEDGDSVIIDLLLRQPNIDINQFSQDTSGTKITALEMAILKEDQDCIRHLLRRGATITDRTIQEAQKNLDKYSTYRINTKKIQKGSLAYKELNNWKENQTRYYQELIKHLQEEQTTQQRTEEKELQQVLRKQRRIKQEPKQLPSRSATSLINSQSDQNPMARAYSNPHDPIGIAFDRSGLQRLLAKTRTVEQEDAENIRHQHIPEDQLRDIAP